MSDRYSALPPDTGDDGPDVVVNTTNIDGLSYEPQMIGNTEKAILGTIPAMAGISTRLLELKVALRQLTKAVKIQTAFLEHLARALDVGADDEEFAANPEEGDEL